MSPYIRNQTFSLPTGEVSINKDGLRLVNVTGEFFDSKTGQYTVEKLFLHLIFVSWYESYCDVR